MDDPHDEVDLEILKDKEEVGKQESRKLDVPSATRDNESWTRKARDIREWITSQILG